MKNERELLKISGIIECIAGAMCLKTLGIPLILIGIYLYLEANSTDEEIINNRYIYLTLAILSFINVIGFATILTCYDNITRYNKKVNGTNAPPKRKNVYIDEESKKIDILLKLGVGMVFISGILFATTTWSFLNNYIKAFALIVLGALFILLSIFTENKLKLYRSSFMYWLLGISFFILTIVGILYFGIFGSFLTYAGTGKALAYAITLLSSSGFLYATYLKYPKINIFNLSFLTFLIGLYNVLFYCLKSDAISICIITGLITILNIINRKDNLLSNICKVISYSLLVLSIKITQTSEICLLIACIINLINFNYQTVLNKKEETSIINIVITYVLILTYLSNYSNSNSITITILLTTIYTLLINMSFINTSSITKNVNYVVFSMISLFSYFYTSIMLLNNINYNLLLISLVYLMITELSKKGLLNSSKITISKYIEPVVIYLSVLSIAKTFVKQYNPLYVLVLVTLIYSAVSFLAKNKQTKKYYFIFAIIGNVISILFNNNNIIVTIISIISSLIIFVKADSDNDYENSFKTSTYILLLSSIYIPFILNNQLKISITINSTFLILIILLISIILKKKNITVVSNFYIILPLLSIISDLKFEYTYKIIMTSITLLYLSYLVIKYLTKNCSTRNLIAIISLIIFLFPPFLVESIYGGIYVGIVSILCLIIGFRNDKYTPIFTTGIILTIVNILYRLKGLWKLLPFWLYLLLGGLLIIGFVTYKEVKKNK